MGILYGYLQYMYPCFFKTIQYTRTVNVCNDDGLVKWQANWSCWPVTKQKPNKRGKGKPSNSGYEYDPTNVQSHTPTMPTHDRVFQVYSVYTYTGRKEVSMYWLILHINAFITGKGYNMYSTTAQPNMLANHSHENCIQCVHVCTDTCTCNVDTAFQC